MYTFTEEPTRAAGNTTNIDELRNVLESQVREAWATAELWKQKFIANSQTLTQSQSIISKPATSSNYDDRELSSLRNQVASLTQEVKRLESDKQRLQYESSNRGSSNNSAAWEAQLRDAKADAERRVESTRTAYENQLQDLRRELTEANRKMSELQSKLTQAQYQSQSQAATVKPFAAQPYQSQAQTTTSSVKPTSPPYQSQTQAPTITSPIKNTTSQLYSSVTTNVNAGNGATYNSNFNSSGYSSNVPVNGSTAGRINNSYTGGYGSGFNTASFTENQYKTSTPYTATNARVESKSISEGFGKAPLTSSLAFANKGDLGNSGGNTFDNSVRALGSSNYESSLGSDYQFKTKGSVTPLSSRKI